MYSIFPKFILRTPALSYDTLSKINNKIELNSLLGGYYIQNALYISSKELYSEVQKYQQNKLNEKETHKLILSVNRYLLRMSTRCTPFGLFAGFSLGEWANSTAIQLSDTAAYQPHTRLDMNYLCSVASKLSTNNELRNELLFYPNNSIYTLGDKIRYVDYNYINNRRVHNISSVANSEYIATLLRKAQQGSTIKDLVESIVETDISYAEAEDFALELRKKHKIEIYLAPPEKFRPKVEINDLEINFKGNLESNIELILIGNYECEGCLQAKPIIDNLFSKYNKNIKAGFIYYDNQPSLASVAVESARLQNKFWEMHEIINKKHQSIDTITVINYATELELNLTKFKSDLLLPSIKQRIEKNIAIIEQNKIVTTPTIIINGRVFNAPFSEIELDDFINKLIKK